MGNAAARISSTTVMSVLVHGLLRAVTLAFVELVVVVIRYQVFGVLASVRRLHLLMLTTPDPRQLRNPHQHATESILRKGVGGYKQSGRMLYTVRLRVRIARCVQQHI